MESTAIKTERRTALSTFLYWGVPPALCLALYWHGLRAWFQMDDFAWLGLSQSVHGPRDLLHALFAPMAQGTIRPLSERAFFLLLHSLFGLWALPYHACVFLTQFANLALVSWISRRITGSSMAGFLAPVLWTVNGALVVPLSWTSAWNQVLCGFSLLAAFACLLRYLDTGNRRWLAGQFAAFLLGLGALELAAVYPALAALYCLTSRRGRLRTIAPLFAGSAAYAGLHLWASRAASSASAAYTTDFGWPMLRLLVHYWNWSLNLGRLDNVAVIPGPDWVAPAATALLSAALLGFAGWQIARRRLLAAFLLGWFLLLILPVLPFRDHLTEYYPALPAIGLAILGAWAFQAALAAGWRRALAAQVALAVFVFSGCLEARRGSRATAERSYRARTLTYGVARARQSHPGKTIVLTGMEDELFWATFPHRPFRLVGASDIFMAPEQPVRARPGQLEPFVMPPGLLIQALEKRTALVYRVEPRRLRGVTWAFLAEAGARWTAEDPLRVDAGQAAFAQQLGPTWYAADGGHRWMPRQATLRLRGPRTAQAVLAFSGYCPAAQVAGRPLKVKVAVDGTTLNEFSISRGDSEFHFTVPLPPKLAGRPRVEVAIEVDHTFRAPGDARELGLAFGSFEIRE